jgi:hypothetical protein
MRGANVLRDGTIITDRRLDRLIEFDERSRQHPVMALLATGPTKVPRSKDYRCDVHLDQGREGACAEFGVTHEMLCTPAPVDPAVGAAITRGHLIYYPAQRDDPWEGGSYPGASPVYEGTSVLSAVKQVVRLGYATGYKWCFGIGDFIMAMGYAGPVILGITMTANMMGHDARGFIRATGPDVGGHCLLAKGLHLVWQPGTTSANKREVGWLAYVDLDRSSATLHQSWGERYGIRGDVYISLRDLADRLDADGESCVMVGRKRLSKVPLA